MRAQGRGGSGAVDFARFAGEEGHGDHLGAAEYKRNSASEMLASLRIEKSDQAIREFIGVSQLAFPHDENTPTEATQPRPDLLVSFGISRQFGLPKHDAGFGHPLPISATMTVPEAAMNENDCPPGSKDNVRSPRNA